MTRNKFHGSSFVGTTVMQGVAGLMQGWALTWSYTEGAVVSSVYF